MHVKICGITRLEDALVAADAGADLAGLILADSKRRVTIAGATSIAERLPTTTQPVLLFQDQPFEEIEAALDATGARWVQLHGLEPPTLIQSLRGRFPGLGVIRAWDIGHISDSEHLRNYLLVCGSLGATVDIVILDVRKGAPHPGYDCLAAAAGQLAGQQPELWLAGGLTPDNLAEAADRSLYHGVDVASGVERSPGIKDHDAVRGFVAAARSLRAAPRSRS